MNKSEPTNGGQSSDPETPRPTGRTTRRVLDRWADSPLAGMLGPTLLILGKLVRRQIEMALAEEGLGLTAAQARSIVVLHFHGPIRQHELAALTEVEPSTLVGILDVMERDGLAVREPHPTDRRAHLVRLTDQGERRVPELFALWGRVESHLVEGRDSDEVARLRERLESFIDRLSEGGESCE